MLEIFLYILVGSVAGVLAFFSCMYIWDVRFQKVSTLTPEEAQEMGSKESDSSPPLYIPPEPELRSSIPLQFHELSLSTEKHVVGSFIDVARKVDGVKTSQRIFLN